MDAQQWLEQRTFEWNQPGRSCEEYALMAGGEKAGWLKFDHWRRESGQGETPYGRWKFKVEGFWNRRFLIYESDSGKEVAVYSPRWSATEGTLRSDQGRLFRWRSRSFWSGEHALIDEAGRTVFVLRRGTGKFRWRDMFKQKATITREDASPDGRTLSILFLFAWWMILVEDEESAAAAVAVMG